MKRLIQFGTVSWAIIIVGGVLFGGVAGKVVSSIVSIRAEKFQLQRRAELRKAILGTMKTLQIGDTLVDQEFDDLDGRTFRLSSLVRTNGGAIVAIISPDCMVCAQEVSGLSKLVPDTTLRSRIIFISAGSVQELENLRRVSGLYNLFLCDRRGDWSSQYQVHTYPLNLVVDRNLVIREVVPSNLLESDVEEFAKQTVRTDLTQSNP